MISRTEETDRFVQTAVSLDTVVGKEALRKFKKFHLENYSSVPAEIQSRIMTSGRKRKVSECVIDFSFEPVLVFSAVSLRVLYYLSVGELLAYVFEMTDRQCFVDVTVGFTTVNRRQAL